MNPERSFIHNDTNWVKVIEGGYGGKGGNSKGRAEF